MYKENTHRNALNVTFYKHISRRRAPFAVQATTTFRAWNSDSMQNSRGGSTRGWTRHQGSHSGPGPSQHDMLSFHGELHTIPLVLLLLKFPGFVTQKGKKIFIFSNEEVFFNYDCYIWALKLMFLLLKGSTLEFSLLLPRTSTFLTWTRE